MTFKELMCLKLFCVFVSFLTYLLLVSYHAQSMSKSQTTEIDNSVLIINQDR